MTTFTGRQAIPGVERSGANGSAVHSQAAARLSAISAVSSGCVWVASRRSRADNLLTKADRVLAHGDPDRARDFIDRAAALDYDEHGRTARLPSPQKYARSRPSHSQNLR